MRSARLAWGCSLLSLIGIGLCMYLTLVHVALLRGELIGGGGCSAAGTLFNCHAVAASPFGSLLGLPLSLWGLIGYLATLTLATIAWQFPEWAERAFSALAGLGVIFVAVDAVLLVIMVTRIGYLCPACLGSYAINIGLTWCAASAAGKRLTQVIRGLGASLMTWRPQARVAVVAMFWGVVITGIAGSVSVQATARFAIEGPPGSLRRQMAEFVRQQPRVGVTTTGDPTLGGPGAAIRLVEFSDFLCPSCQRAAKFNALMLAGHRSRASFTFKHYPLDQACNDKVQRTVHPNACQIAAATECAHEQGKFWALHDRLFGKLAGMFYNLAELEGDAEAAGVNVPVFRECLQAGRGMEAVKRDIEEAARLKVHSTPTYVVNGTMMTGVLTPAAFQELVAVLRESQ
ncbi:MAG: hypothetical protein A3E56_01885 [Omnitrophica WOR_2 bacterium RIFCSPHIGHO2_12_FULL_64_13]|nr:MAG: hypothetical protein A3E56_01885 [Omnitrophica WOR_2 bacterium RIFCSPHIGHO2_12_FULL_64_13]